MEYNYKSLEKLKKEHPEYKVDVNYYFYHHGDLDWKYKTMNYILGKNFKLFKKEYNKKKKEEWCYLPDTATVFVEKKKEGKVKKGYEWDYVKDLMGDINITKEKNFLCITDAEAECG